MAVVIAVKPIPGKPGIGPDDGPGAPDDGGEAGSDVGMDIVDQCKQLPPDDIKTLTQGISPEAIEVMEKIPELAPFANYIEHGSPDEEQPEAPPGNTGPMGRRSDIRGSVMQAMGKHGMDTDY